MVLTERGQQDNVSLDHFFCVCEFFWQNQCLQEADKTWLRENLMVASPHLPASLQHITEASRCEPGRRDQRKDSPDLSQGPAKESVVRQSLLRQQIWVRELSKDHSSTCFASFHSMGGLASRKPHSTCTHIFYSPHTRGVHWLEFNRKCSLCESNFRK